MLVRTISTNQGRNSAQAKGKYIIHLRSLVVARANLINDLARCKLVSKLLSALTELKQSLLGIVFVKWLRHMHLSAC